MKYPETLFEFAVNTMIYYQELKPELPINEQQYADEFVVDERAYFAKLLKLKRVAENS